MSKVECIYTITPEARNSVLEFMWGLAVEIEERFPDGSIEFNAMMVGLEMLEDICRGHLGITTWDGEVYLNKLQG